MHDLYFRAATAIFGHLGIEWDLAKATEAELAELGDWIAFYKEHRDLLLRGDLVRIDFPDETLYAHGWSCRRTERRAIYSYASVARSEVVLLGRVPMPGLDPGRRYRVAPALLQHAPSGLRPPPWWGVTVVREHHEYQDLATHKPPTYTAAGKTPGVVLPGSVLASVGLAAAPIDPDHALIYLVEAVD